MIPHASVEHVWGTVVSVHTIVSFDFATSVIPG